MRGLVHRWLRDEDGQDLIEYALLAVYVALAAAAGVGALGVAINAVFTAIATELQTIGTP